MREREREQTGRDRRRSEIEEGVRGERAREREIEGERMERERDTTTGVCVWCVWCLGVCVCGVMCQVKSSQVKLSFIVIPLHVWTYSGTRCRASQDHGAT